MSRAWPFEGVEDSEKFRHPRHFVEAKGEGTEAVVIRIGMNTSQLVLVDRDGRWQRWVYHSVQEAKSVGEDLGLPVHIGEYPEELRVRINRYQRPQADFDRGAYPEQGAVGPVIPYPENRPRRLDALKKEVSEQTTQDDQE